MALDQQASESAERCRLCPKMCQFACPVSHESARESLSPWGKMSLLSLTVGAKHEPFGLPSKLESLAQAARRFVETPQGRPLDADAAEAFYACTGCLRCQVPCEHDTDVPEALMQGRAAAVEAGVAPAGASATAAKYRDNRHPRGDALAEALGQLNRTMPVGKRDAHVLFAGCDAPIDTPATVGRTIRVAKALGVTMGVAAEPICCGRPLFESGHRTLFRERVEDAWDRLGSRTVVTLSASCARALTDWARLVGVEPRGPVVHVTTFLAHRMNALPPRPALAEAITFHDPCQLSRGLKELEAPRRLLQKANGVAPAEARTCREISDCCGAGGILDATHPDIANAMARSRADELRATGTRRVATAAPECRRALTEAGLEVVDVVDVVAEWLGVPEEP